MTHFERIVQRTRRRVRLQNAVRGGSWGAIGGLAFTLGALLALYLYAGLGTGGPVRLELVWPWLWLGPALINGVAVLVGAAWGAFRRVDESAALYRVDRALGTGERLVTLYDLRRGRGDEAFVPLLEREVEGLTVRPASALRWDRRDAWRGGGILLLFAACTALILGLGLGGGPWGWERAGAAWQREGTVTSPSRSRPWASPPQRAALPPGLAAKVESLERRVARLPQSQDQDRGLPDEDSGWPAQVERLRREIARVQDELLGLNPDGSGEQAPAEAAPARARARAEQRERLRRLQQSLEALKEQLERGQAPSAALMDRLRQDLDALGEDSLRRVVAGALEDSDPDPQVQRERLDQALEQIRARREADRRLEETRLALDDRPDRRSGQPSDYRQDEGEQTASPGQGESQRQGSGPGLTQGQDQTEGGPGQGERPGDLSPGTGEEAGQSTGEDRQAYTVPFDPRFQAAQISGRLAEEGRIAELLSPGVPVETDTSDPGAPVYRLSYAQVEALLEARDLPLELRAVVRAYFLALIGQWRAQEQEQKQKQEQEE